jgi:hypothetical protein
MARTSVHGMTSALVASAMLGAFVSHADDLQVLKAAAGRYVAAIKTALDLPEAADCSEITSKACGYAAAKVAYYKAARQAMPFLIQMAKGEKTDTRYGGDLIELFFGSGEEDDEQATVLLLSKLRGCEDFHQSCEERKAIEDAERIAEQFLKDFGQLAGISEDRHRIFQVF